MGIYSCNMLLYPHSTFPLINDIRKTFYFPFGNSILQTPTNFGFRKIHCRWVAPNVEEMEQTEIQVEKPRFTWLEIGPNITEAQKKTIAQLPPKMSKRCKALMRQIICFSPQKCSLSDLLAAWVRIMKPRRADWLAILKELSTMDHPLYLEVLLTFSFSFLGLC
jgi:hypothetical protein